MFFCSCGGNLWDAALKLLNGKCVSPVGNGSSICSPHHPLTQASPGLSWSRARRWRPTTTRQCTPKWYGAGWSLSPLFPRFCFPGRGGWRRCVGRPQCETSFCEETVCACRAPSTGTTGAAGRPWQRPPEPPERRPAPGGSVSVQAAAWAAGQRRWRWGWRNHTPKESEGQAGGLAEQHWGVNSGA